MDTAVPYAVDEQMRVEALRAAVAFCSGDDVLTVLDVAEHFLVWLLNEEPPVGLASLNSALEGSE